MRFDLSTHVHFFADELLARLIKWHDEQPLWDSTLTMEEGSTTVSPFVTSVDRAYVNFETGGGVHGTSAPFLLRSHARLTMSETPSRAGGRVARPCAGFGNGERASNVQEIQLV